MQHAQPSQYISKPDRASQNLTTQTRFLEAGAPVIAPSGAGDRCRANPWRVLAYEAVCLPFLFLFGLTWLRPNFNRHEIPDWKPVFALAEVAREKDDLYNATSLYSQAGKFAAWREDWAGLLAAACGMKKLERERGPYSISHTLLVRARVAAESRKSATGMTAVGDAFAALGEHNTASMSFSRVQENWVEENNDSADVVLPDCWPPKQEEQSTLGGR